MKDKNKVAELIAALKAELDIPFEIAAIEECERKLNEGLPKVEIIDEKHQKFNGRIYSRRGKYGYFVRQEFLHITVMETFIGNQIPNDHDVHHNTKDNNGKWDKSKNNIKDLQLVTKKHHRKLHVEDQKLYKCQLCGIEYKASIIGHSKYCDKCKSEVKKKITKKSKEKNRIKLNEYAKQYYAKNRERIREQQKQNNEKNREKILERRRQNYAKNREKIREYNKQYCIKNREKILKRRRENYAKNRNKTLEI